VADLIGELKVRARDAGVREPSTAEFLDAVVACRDLGIQPDSPTWRRLADALLWKHETESLVAKGETGPRGDPG
jgi:hypothetical protein